MAIPFSRSPSELSSGTALGHWRSHSVDSPNTPCLSLRNLRLAGRISARTFRPSVGKRRKVVGRGVAMDDPGVARPDRRSFKVSGKSMGDSRLDGVLCSSSPTPRLAVFRLAKRRFTEQRSLGSAGMADRRWSLCTHRVRQRPPIRWLAGVCEVGSGSWAGRVGGVGKFGRVPMQNCPFHQKNPLVSIPKTRVDRRHQLAWNGHTLYMVRLFAALGLILFFLSSHAQSSLSFRVLDRWEQEQQNPSLSSRDSLLEWLTHCETHPLPLNEIPLGQLLDWCFLRPNEAVALAFYRDKGGSLMSWNELHFVRPLDSLSEKALKTYCVLQKTPYPTFWHATTRGTLQIPWRWGVSTRIAGKKWSITASRSPSTGQWHSTGNIGRWSANGTYVQSKGIHLRIGFQHLWPAGKGSWYGGYSAQGFHFQHRGSYTLRGNQSLRWHFQKEPALLWGQNLLGELEFTKQWSAVGGESTLHLQWIHSAWSSPSGQWR